MALLALGINHKTATVAVREKVAFAPERLMDALSAASDYADLQELVILSTCNRTELYCASEQQAPERLLDW